MTMPVPQPPASAGFNARPLTDPVDPAEVRSFSAQMRAQSAATGTSASTGRTIFLAAFLSVFALGFLVVFVPAIVAVTGMLSSSGSPGLAVLPIVVVAAVIIGIGLLAWSSWRRRRVRRYRLHRFASLNGMSYVASIKEPPLPGMIFSLGSSRETTDVVRGTRPRFVEFGNYEYTTGSGKNRSTHHWGYVAVKLDVPLPNIVLDAIGNNSIFGSNLPASFQKSQRLSLDGDFDQYFQLYCPDGYEPDALYLFTPDIMARFIDHAAQLDVEIVDDWMFLYMPRAASTLDAQTWAWLFGTVGALMTKFDQWARWRDDRLRAAQADAETQARAAAQTGLTEAQHPDAVSAATLAGTAPALPFAPPAGTLAPPPGVALQGRRLKKSASWVAVLGVVMVIGVVALRIMMSF
ncbi:hypothetical protein FM104_02550 [Microbacterium esteraromaticum]|uniref:DUF3137 domain-containing protein n=1 Tax=Microbacterium esteraromaticum TaxID=57043 RepID=A0A1R4IK31_9MICO|nr:hypothetical protein [Microbacterium esteraromaticum]SJN20138.1 hypothetical protein FM104_02550 [Microbacterium esteraromaticum]